MLYAKGFTGPTYTNIRGLDFNADGKITAYEAGTLTRHKVAAQTGALIQTESANEVAVPLADLERLVAAKDARIQIRTMDGKIAAQFSTERIPGSSYTVIVPIRDFLAQVKAERTKK